MRFSLTHRFEAPLDEVERLANSGDFQAELDLLPNVGSRHLLELTAREDGSMHRVTKYSLGSQLPAPVVAVLGQSATWNEIADYDPSSHTWTFRIEPHVLGGQLDCHGTYTFEADGPDATKRTVDVEITVKVPIVGGRAEREIKKGLVETMEAEAELLAEHLNR